MSRELNDAEYASMLAGGNVTIAWHSLMGKKCTYEEMTEAFEAAVYRAVRQVFSDRLQIELPMVRPNLFSEESQ